MGRPFKCTRGFTFIELLLVMAILSIIVVSAMPDMIHITDEAKKSVVDAIYTNIKTSIQVYGATEFTTNGVLSYPKELDNVPNKTTCSETTPCFTEVLKIPVTSNWMKLNKSVYVTLPEKRMFFYFKNKGEFKEWPW